MWFHPKCKHDAYHLWDWSLQSTYNISRLVRWRLRIWLLRTVKCTKEYFIRESTVNAKAKSLLINLHSVSLNPLRFHLAIGYLISVPYTGVLLFLCCIAENRHKGWKMLWKGGYCNYIKNKYWKTNVKKVKCSSLCPTNYGLLRSIVCATCEM